MFKQSFGVKNFQLTIENFHRRSNKQKYVRRRKVFKLRVNWALSIFLFLVVKFSACKKRFPAYIEQTKKSYEVFYPTCQQSLTRNLKYFVRRALFVSFMYAENILSYAGNFIYIRSMLITKKKKNAQHAEFFTQSANLLEKLFVLIFDLHAPNKAKLCLGTTWMHAIVTSLLYKGNREMENIASKLSILFMQLEGFLRK